MIRDGNSWCGFALVLFTLASVAVASIDDGLVLLYEFEGDGDVLIDSSGNGFDGKLGTASRTDVGLLGKGIEFTAPDQFADAAVDEGLVAKDAFTISVWAKPLALDPEGENRVTYKHDQFNLDLQFGRGRLEVRSGKRWWGTEAREQPLVELNKWLHMALTFSTTSGAAMYHNGVRVAENLEVSSLDETNDYWRLGNLGHAAFVGIMDQHRWYHRAMTDSEVLELFEEPIAVSPIGTLTTSWGNIKRMR